MNLILNSRHRQPLAVHWGSGTTSSSDGQFFRAGGRGEVGGVVNLRYGSEPGVKFYTHVSDQFGPYHTKVIVATANEAPHVLDGLLYHQSSLVIHEHYTDTGGFSYHVFAMCRLLSFRFAPRIRDLKEKRLYPLPGRHRASGLNLLVAAIIFWNTVYLQRAVNHLRRQGYEPTPNDLAHLSPLGWEHINLTGDYDWSSSPVLGPDQFRPLRTRAQQLGVAA